MKCAYVPYLDEYYAQLFYYNKRLDKLVCRCPSHSMTIVVDAIDWKCVSEEEACVILIHQQ